MKTTTKIIIIVAVALALLAVAAYFIVDLNNELQKQKEDNEKYKQISSLLNNEDKKILDYTLKTGILLNNASNDKSSVLDNLYKIATTPRAKGLNNSKIMQDTLKSIANPYTITQRFGDIPDEYKETVVNKVTNNSQNLITRKSAEFELENLFSGCCVAASEQFNLAKKQPAEYARFVEGLSSPNKSVEKDIKLDSLSENTTSTTSETS